MSLQNLLKIKEHEPTPAELQRLLAAAARNLADAQVVEVSDETRFDAAYPAVMQCALAALLKALRARLKAQHPDLLHKPA